MPRDFEEILDLRDEVKNPPEETTLGGTQQNVIDRIENDLAAVARRTRAEVAVDITRFDGKSPWRVERSGDFVMLWGTTGLLADGASVTVYLTENREAGGDALFRNEPMWRVTEDAVGDIGGVAQATGPEKPSASYCSRQTNADYTVDLAWVPSNEVWAMTVTNNTGSTKDFLVKAQGV